MNITFRQLRVFVEVVRHGSVLRAAEALHLTPPAVSMQIKEVESQVGLPLFDRAGRRLSLSTAGEYFAVYAQRLLGTLKDAEDAMARFKGVESGVLTIGMVSAAKYFLPQLLAQFHAEHPAVDVRLRLGNREQLVALMQAKATPQEAADYKAFCLELANVAAFVTSDSGAISAIAVDRLINARFILDLSGAMKLPAGVRRARA